MTYVVLPQAVRNVLPDLLSNTLEVMKLTSLGSVWRCRNSSTRPARRRA
jgi:ABC-type amino acid transport system permease subunit